MIGPSPRLEGLQFNSDNSPSSGPMMMYHSSLERSLQDRLIQELTQQRWVNLRSEQLQELCLISQGLKELILSSALQEFQSRYYQQATRRGPVSPRCHNSCSPQSWVQHLRPTEASRVFKVVSSPLVFSTNPYG